ncbi:hypothetical protein AYI68_g1445 [Smittium mucronatum]|uniref:Integrator complex subunit 7 N-terminal domain-containing protein n=1 Tax=Smittium mucronatum TaxID=133383 RepID=A0A1R0H5M0_9FUNG|nr:hypothetical protein AYI68_g1445 [Smittium mucronatum]
MVYNANELTKRILIVLDSNDHIARSLTLRLLGIASIIFCSSLEVQYRILQRYETNNELELVALIDATQKMLEYSPSFLELAWESISYKLTSEQVSLPAKIQLLFCAKHAQSHPTIRQWVVNYCTGYILKYLESNDLFTDNKEPFAKKLPYDELIDPMLITWSCMIGPFKGYLSEKDVLILQKIIIHGSETNIYNTLIVLYNGVDSSIESSNDTIQFNIYSNLINILNSSILLKSSLNRILSRKKITLSFKIILKCSANEILSNLSLSVAIRWLSKDLELSKSTGLNNSHYSFHRQKFEGDSESSPKILIWKLFTFLNIIEPLLNPLKGNAVPSEEDLTEKIKSTTFEIIECGWGLIPKAYLSQTSNTSDNNWLLSFLKSTVKTSINVLGKNYLRSLGHLAIQNLSSSIPLFALGASKTLKAIAVINPTEIKNTFLPILSEILRISPDTSSTPEILKIDHHNPTLHNFRGVLLCYLKIQHIFKNDQSYIEPIHSESESLLDTICNKLESTFNKNEESCIKEIKDLGVEFTNWILIDSIACGKWKIVEILSCNVLKLNLSVSSFYWWDSLFSLAKSESSGIEFEARDGFRTSALTKLHLLHSNFPTRFFQPIVVSFHQDAHYLVHSIKQMITSNVSVSQSAQINLPYDFSRLKLEIMSLIERCVRLQTSHSSIDATTIEFLYGWEKLLGVVIRTKSSDISRLLSLVPPTLCLGAVYIKSPPCISLEIETSPEFEIGSEKSLPNSHENGKQNIDKKFVKAPAGSQFSISIQGLINDPNSGTKYSRNKGLVLHDLESSGKNISFGVESSSFISNLEDNSSAVQASLLSEKPKFKASVWLSDSSERILPRNTIVKETSLCPINESPSELDYFNGDDDLVNLFFDDGSFCSKNNLSVPWQQYLDKVQTFSTEIKVSFFECNISIALPPISSFNTVSKPRISGDSGAEVPHLVLLGKIEPGFRAIFYIHVLPSILDKFSKSWYVGQHLVFPICLYSQPNII